MRSPEEIAQQWEALNKICHQPVRVDIASKVQEDIEGRAKLGKIKYGARLAALSRENGKTPFENMYEEILDMAMYLKQYLVEEGK